MIDLIIGVLLGAVASWLIAHIYYQRSTDDLEQQLRKLKNNSEWKGTLNYYEYMLTSSDWAPELIDEKTVWICAKDNDLRIETGDNFEDFVEPWTQWCPDKNSKKVSVYLKRRDQSIREIIFIHLDGHRIIVPMPRQVMSKGPDGTYCDPIYCWEVDSVEYKTGKIIGDYYRFNCIEEIAKLSGVTILHGQART